jgi:hypothetical protein
VLKINKEKIAEGCKFVAVILLIMVLGFSAVNLFIEYRYKLVWMSTPCDLCCAIPDNKDVQCSAYYTLNPIYNYTFNNSQDKIEIAKGVYLNINKTMGVE